MNARRVPFAVEELEELEPAKTIADVNREAREAASLEAEERAKYTESLASGMPSQEGNWSGDPGSLGARRFPRAGMREVLHQGLRQLSQVRASVGVLLEMGWEGEEGDPDRVREALERLENQLSMDYHNMLAVTGLVRPSFER